MPIKKKTTTKLTKSASKSRKVGRKTQRKDKQRNKLVSVRQLATYGGVLIAVLVFLVFGANVFGSVQNKDSKKSESNVHMMLESDKTIAYSGDIVTIKVYADSAATNVNAVQAAVKYPSDILEFKEVDAANSGYPIQAYQSTDDGKIEVVRGVVGGVSNKQLVAELKFVAKAAGNAQLTFDKDGTILVDSTTNKNILEKSSFNDSTIEVQ